MVSILVINISRWLIVQALEITSLCLGSVAYQFFGPERSPNPLNLFLYLYKEDDNNSTKHMGCWTQCLVINQGKLSLSIVVVFNNPYLFFTFYWSIVDLQCLVSGIWQSESVTHIHIYAFLTYANIFIYVCSCARSLLCAESLFSCGMWGLELWRANS